MRLKNKKTGEIAEFKSVDLYKGYGIKLSAESLAELNKEWEDVIEELKDYWWISPVDTDIVHCVEDVKDEMDQYNKQIGNYFNTREEAELAVEKLKAWKRLRDKGITFEAKVIDRKWYIAPKANPSQRTFDEAHDIHKDLMIIFGGK